VAQPVGPCRIYLDRGTWPRGLAIRWLSGPTAACDPPVTPGVDGPTTACETSRTSSTDFPGVRKRGTHPGPRTPRLNATTRAARRANDRPRPRGKPPQHCCPVPLLNISHESRGEGAGTPARSPGPIRISPQHIWSVYPICAGCQVKISLADGVRADTPTARAASGFSSKCDWFNS
jgi:hypothetical protein